MCRPPPPALPSALLIPKARDEKGVRRRSGIIFGVDAVRRPNLHHRPPPHRLIRMIRRNGVGGKLFRVCSRGRNRQRGSGRQRKRVPVPGSLVLGCLAAPAGLPACAGLVRRRRGRQNGSAVSNQQSAISAGRGRRRQPPAKPGSRAKRPSGNAVVAQRAAGVAPFSPIVLVAFVRRFRYKESAGRLDSARAAHIRRWSPLARFFRERRSSP